MTKTPQQIKNEVEKGCGIFLYEDEFGDKDDLFNHDVNCGTYLVRDNKLVLCPSCQAKLSILTEYDKSIKEMIEDLSNIEFMGVSGNQARKLIQEELLSKIGEEKQDE